MKTIQFTIGFSPVAIANPVQPVEVTRRLKAIRPYNRHIYDIHFPHYNPNICASGRPLREDIPLNQARKITFDMIRWNAENTRFKFTLLLNYLLHDNYKVVVDNVATEFYPRGVKSVVVADLELIKRLKDRMPDLEIQGSCLSNRMTPEALEEERKEGVVLHNPSVNIIRRPDLLKQNAAAGYAQKVIVFEGCLHHCPDENSPYGHRWYLARSITKTDAVCTRKKIASDPRYFFKANWVTARRLKTLLPHMTVVKLPRNNQLVDYTLKHVLDALENDTPYNVLDYISAGHQRFLRRDVGYISSKFFDNHFFDTTEACNMDCEKRKCNLCFALLDRIKRMSYKQKRLARRQGQPISRRAWHIEPMWQRKPCVARI